MAEDTNLKFYMQIDRKGYYTKKWKSGQKGAWTWSRDLLFKFWDPLISLARLKIQTSNFARGSNVRDRILKNAKLVKTGHSYYVQHLGPVTS